MGLADRDYSRASGAHDGLGRARGWLHATGAPLTLAIILGAAASFLVTAAVPQVGQALAMEPYQALRGWQVWRWVTNAFVHYGLLHLGMNLLMLWWFGAELERLWGTRRYGGMLLASLLASSLAVVAMTEAGVIPPSYHGGASGMVMGAIVAFTCLFPTMPSFFGLPLWVVTGFFVAVDLSAGFGGARTGISHFAHLGGAAMGFFCGYLGFRPWAWLAWPRGWWQRRHGGGRIVRRTEWQPRERLDAPVSGSWTSADFDELEVRLRVDELLEKISRHGRDALTSEEREFLNRASERL